MNGIIIFIGLIFILFIGRALFTPLILSLFIWYLINSVAAYYRKVMPWRESWGAGAASFALAIASIGWFVYVFIMQIRPMFVVLATRLPEIQHRLYDSIAHLAGQFGIELSISAIPNIGSLAANIGMSAAGWLATLGLVLVYIFFMFIEQSTFQKKIAAVFPDKKRSKKINFIVKSIAANMKKYMFMKTAVSVATALLSYAWMKYFGLEFAGVWAFIIFILNYIPTFGTIIATSLPIIYAMLVAPMLVIPIAAGLITVQLVLSNLLEPRLTGQTLNLSTLAILINLVFWGMLWGPVGMFFSVPLLVATFVITSQFDRTRWIAVLLSSNGQIPEKKG